MNSKRYVFDWLVGCDSFNLGPVAAVFACGTLVLPIVSLVCSLPLVVLISKFNWL
jgi:hypothetical protein